MKLFTTILIILALGLIGFNISVIDFNKSLLHGKGFAALVGILASLIAVFILILFKMSKRIEDKMKD